MRNTGLLAMVVGVLGAGHPFEWSGMYEDDWGSKMIISPDLVISMYSGGTPSAYHITSYDNEEGYMVGQNGQANDWNNGSWSRFDFVVDDDGALWQCQSHYAAATEEEAAVPNPLTNHAGYAETGCTGQFPFSKMMPPPSAPFAFEGFWSDEWGTNVMISSGVLTSGYTGSFPSIFTVTHYDNDAGFLVAQNSAANEWNPGSWSRFDFVKDTEDAVWYCQTHYAAADETTAMEEHPDHDHAAYATDGCNGFAFSKITRMDLHAGHAHDEEETDDHDDDACAAYCARKRARHLLFGAFVDPEPHCVC